MQNRMNCRFKMDVDRAIKRMMECIQQEMPDVRVMDLVVIEKYIRMGVGVGFDIGHGSIKKNGKAVAINQVKDGVVIQRWESVGEVSRIRGYNETSIHRALRGKVGNKKYTQAYGYKWEYAEKNIS